MSEFRRETRYIVIKLKRLNPESLEAIKDTLESYQIPTEECVVVEHDWPNYEHTWDTIQDVVKGTFDPDEVRKLQDAFEAAAEKNRALESQLLALREALDTSQAILKQKQKLGCDCWPEECGLCQAIHANTNALNATAQAAEKLRREIQAVECESLAVEIRGKAVVEANNPQEGHGMKLAAHLCDKRAQQLRGGGE